VKVGMGFFFQASGRKETDLEVFEQELRLASLAEPLGFDSVWTSEHHWTDYAMVPAPLQVLAFMAGRTQRIALGTHVLVLPWHQPERLVGEIGLLDNLCDGRFLLGIGRGLGKHEFDGFGIDMSETRDRFNEIAEVVLDALETGSIEYSGQYVNVPQRDVRPAPVRSFKGRTYGAAVRPESLDVMARLGSGLIIIPQKPWDTVREELAHYRSRFESEHGEQAPSPVVCVHLYCDRDGAKAKELGHVYNQQYYHRVMAQYGLTGSHFQETAGYEYYAKTASRIAKDGGDEAAAHYADLHVYGNPSECLEKLHWIKEAIGTEHFVCFFAYGGFSYDDAGKSMMLFDEEVRRVLQEDRSFSLSTSS
jgi:alkanesulfonate monooxygenase SsuD/methylene tetrahydromethanopterin reductase-like flavin-dependent oxidoreductase (luciferase family)